MLTWIEPQEISLSAALQSSVGGHPLIAETLVRRGIRDVETARAFLDPDYYQPSPPDELPGLARAAERLESAIRSQEAVCVWGDFDVDGQTSTTLLVSTLRELGARLSYHIPVRASESHGVNLNVLSRILDEGAQLVLTCDTGIAANEAVTYARQRGVDVIISDHHDLPEVLPQAYAVINPKLLPVGHPLGALPGVGVAYKLAEELYRRAGKADACEQHLDLVALGIVADVAIQRGDTRYLLQRGLDVLRQNRRLGLQALLELAELSPTWLSEEHIGFVIGPRLNALGRLSDANPVVEFLTTDNIGRARLLALELQGLNARRKLLTDQVFQGALTQLEREPELLSYEALVLANPAWPAGVIGIVASRLVERFNKPVILLSTPVGEMARGSARSIERVNITAAIAEQAEMLAGYGGHPMAAGLSIAAEFIPEFRRALARAVRRQLGDVQVEATLQIDGYLPLAELSLDLVADLERLAPFGPGNPPLTLASRGLSLKNHKTLGRDAEHLLLQVEDEAGMTRQVVWWQGAGWPLPQGRFDLAYHARASTFGGQRDVQVEWVDFRLLEEPEVILQVERRVIEVQDYRQETHPLPILQRIQAQEDVQVWCEAEAKEKLGGRDRYELSACETLAIWTTPPGPEELHTALETASPQKVILFALDPITAVLQDFIKRLAGLAKFVLRNHQGQARLSVLAAATAQREVCVRKGLDWLAANGHVQILAIDGDQIQLAPGDGQKGVESVEIGTQLKALLDESAAYRSYYSRADKNTLVEAASYN